MSDEPDEEPTKEPHHSWRGGWLRRTVAPTGERPVGPPSAGAGESAVEPDPSDEER
jgi:hypothetical protein